MNLTYNSVFRDVQRGLVLGAVSLMASGAIGCSNQSEYEGELQQAIDNAETNCGGQAGDLAYCDCMYNEVESAISSSSMSGADEAEAKQKNSAAKNACIQDAGIAPAAGPANQWWVEEA